MADIVSVFPFPVLENGNASFPKGVYKAGREKADGDHSVIINHELTGAPFLQEMLDSNKAVYACLVAIPTTGYRRLLTSKSSQQEVPWDKGYMADSLNIRPLIIATEEITHKLGDDDGVAKPWIGKTIAILPGSRLARGPYLRLKSSIVNMLTFRVDENLRPDSMQVDLATDGGLHFVVRMGNNLYRFTRNPDENHKMLYNNICVHAVSRGFELIKRHYSGDGVDGDESWENISVLQVLADKLASEGISHWTDPDFDPVRAATELFPIGVPGHVVADDEEEEG